MQTRHDKEASSASLSELDSRCRKLQVCSQHTQWMAMSMIHQDLAKKIGCSAVVRPSRTSPVHC